jgi:3-hydroxyisobutyrate dehydrogenase-like beta-hydroxyacid dehydrogenase
MVVEGGQVHELLFGEEGAVAGAPPQTLFVDMSTTAPADARRLAAALAEQGHAFIDAPVSGSLPKAETGTLTIMAGASQADMERARPLLDAMGEVILHVGPVGHGQLVKVLTNAVGAVNCATLAQAMVVGARAGVDVEALLAAMGNSAGASLMVGLKGEPMRTHAYTPWFRLSHMLKDVDFALDGRAAPPRPSRSPRWRASSTARPWPAGSARRTTRPSLRWPRRWLTRASDVPGGCGMARWHRG